jgi:hypothetical protein
VFFWWGSNWIRTSGQQGPRYAFWLTISLLAATHFALQLAIQILYIHNSFQPKWLAILGFPHKHSLEKLQVCFGQSRPTQHHTALHRQKVPLAIIPFSS